MRRKYLSFKNFIHSKACSFLVFLLLFFCLFALAKGTIKQYGISREISDKQAEVDKLRKSNAKLSVLIDNFDPVSFGEKEARLKLGMQKEGEKAVIISQPGDSSAAKEADATGQKEIAAKEEKNNPPKWWRYFFD